VILQGFVIGRRWAANEGPRAGQTPYGTSPTRSKLVVTALAELHDQAISAGQAFEHTFPVPPPAR